jgi:hypothetical protein
VHKANLCWSSAGIFHHLRLGADEILTRHDTALELNRALVNERYQFKETCIRAVKFHGITKTLASIFPVVSAA